MQQPQGLGGSGTDPSVVHLLEAQWKGCARECMAYFYAMIVLTTPSGRSPYGALSMLERCLMPEVWHPPNLAANDNYTLVGLIPLRKICLTWYFTGCLTLHPHAPKPHDQNRSLRL